MAIFPSKCCSCSSHGCPARMTAGPSRRAFLTAAAAAALPWTSRAASKDPARQQPVIKPLKVQPVFTYDTPQRRDQTSWRHWGAIQTPQDAAQELERIRREIAALKASAGFPVEFLPVLEPRKPEEGAKIAEGSHDVLLIYAAGGAQRTLETLTRKDRWNLMFLRHRSGPVYLWYEIADPRFLRKTTDQRADIGMGIEDIVVDSQADLAARLRGLHGLNNALNKRIVAIGGPAGWGTEGKKAPDIARSQWKMDIVTVSYPDLGERIKRARSDSSVSARAAAASAAYLKQRGVALQTQRQFVDKAFLLLEVFRDLLDEAKTDAITVYQCMGTIMKYSETTACLPLSVLNDEGYMAFCESDFVVIPSGIFLRYISNKPVFLNDPTHPHHGVVTLAHCTAPRKNDGSTYDPVKLLTHFESDYGAAPKVEMKKGQRITVLDPDFASRRWTGFEGEIVDNPFLAICRSQIDVQIKGSTEKLLAEMKGFHWMSCYGNYLNETGYALKKLGVDWVVV